MAVSDTGPLIHLAEIDSLGLLSIFDQLYIPETVHEELEQGGLPDALADLSFELTEANGCHPQTAELDAGERAALAVAAEYDAVLLTDDLAARESALKADVEVRGSLGVIALGYAQGPLDRDEAASLMQALQRETSLFVTDAVIERGIRLLDDG